MTAAGSHERDCRKAWLLSQKAALSGKAGRENQGFRAGLISDRRNSSRHGCVATGR